MVHADAPPSEPPRVELAISRPEGSSTLQVGNVLNGQWWAEGRYIDLTPPGAVPVPWPIPATVNAASSDLVIRISSTALPRTLYIQAFGGGVDATGEPIDAPFYVLDCTYMMVQLREAGCELQLVGDSMVLALEDFQLHSDTRLTLQMTWAIPDPGAPTEAEIDWATWLLSFSRP